MLVFPFELALLEVRIWLGFLLYGRGTRELRCRDGRFRRPPSWQKAPDSDIAEIVPQVLAASRDVLGT